MFSTMLLFRQSNSCSEVTDSNICFQLSVLISQQLQTVRNDDRLEHSGYDRRKQKHCKTMETSRDHWYTVNFFHTLLKSSESTCVSCNAMPTVGLKLLFHTFQRNWICFFATKFRTYFQFWKIKILVFSSRWSIFITSMLILGNFWFL